MNNPRFLTRKEESVGTIVTEVIIPLELFKHIQRWMEASVRIVSEKSEDYMLNYMLVIQALNRMEKSEFKAFLGQVSVEKLGFSVTNAEDSRTLVLDRTLAKNILRILDLRVKQHLSEKEMFLEKGGKVFKSSISLEVLRIKFEGEVLYSLGRGACHNKDTMEFMTWVRELLFEALFSFDEDLEKM